MRSASIMFGIALLASTVAAQKGAPRIVSLSPRHGDAEVNATKITELKVVFDRAMSRSGYSFCGGGPSFPIIPAGKRPSWKDKRTCILPVQLEPNRTYSLSLNSRSATNFRSAKGVALSPVPWSFSTLPAVLPDKKKQRKLNKAAFEELKEILPSRYSYFDRRGLNWPGIFAQQSKNILASKTTRGWASLVARMLEPTQDMHLYLRIGGETIPTSRRAVDSLYRRHLLENYVRDIKPIGFKALMARTEDELGYLMLAEWTGNLDVDAVERSIEELRSCKGIVVDVRPNSGGGEPIAARIAKYFVTGTKVYAKNCYRLKKGKKGFGPVRERKITGHPDERRLDMPVVVLTSRCVMSSCEAFVLMMRQAPDCTVVGQTTFGSSGNPKPHELSNGVTLVLPSWRALRPDGSCFEGQGLAPDVEVKVATEDLERKDPILERGLAVLRKKLRT